MSEIHTHDNDDVTDRPDNSKGINRNETRLLKYTETIDKLVVQNKQLQKDLSDADSEIDGLNERINESNIRISKNLFYVGLVVLGFLVYSGNKHLTDVEKQLVAIGTTMNHYDNEIQKMKQYNDFIEKNAGTQKDPKKTGGK